MKKYKISIAGGSITAGVCCPNEGRRNGILSWSLASLQTQRDASQPISAGVRNALQKMGVNRAYAPHIAPASAQIIDAREMTDRIYLDDNSILHRKKSLPADGVLLERGKAFVMSGAGCPVIVASDGRDMIVAHAGRDSLIDRGAVMGTPTRRHISVVDAIIDALLDRGSTLDSVQMCMLFSVPADLFCHPLNHLQHGEYNRALAKFVGERWPFSCKVDSSGVFLDLEMLFAEQVATAGIENTFTMLSLAELPELAHTRDGKDPSRRNLVVIKRDQ